MPSQTRVSTKPSFFEDFQGNPAGPAGLKEEVRITKDQCGTPGSVTSACPWGWLCRTQAAAGSSHGFSEVTMLPSSSQERASDGPAWGRGHPRASVARRQDATCVPRTGTVEADPLGGRGWPSSSLPHGSGVLLLSQADPAHGCPGWHRLTLFGGLRPLKLTPSSPVSSTPSLRATPVDAVSVLLTRGTLFSRGRNCAVHSRMLIGSDLHLLGDIKCPLPPL